MTASLGQAANLIDNPLFLGQLFDYMDIEAAAPQPKRAPLFVIRHIIGAILLVALAGVFAYSAYSKIHSENAFDNFQWTFLDLGINSLMAAGIVARLMIGLEMMLALFLLFHIYLKKFTYPAILAVLSIFCIYLTIVLVKQGNTGDCGCFGDKLAMKPAAAIVKNLVMMAVTVLLMFIYPVKPYKNQEIFCIPIAGLAFCIPFLVILINNSSAPVPYKRDLGLNRLYQYNPAPDVDLRKGKHIVAFMSLTCPHCKKAAYLLQIIHREHPSYPIYMVIDGSDNFKKAFFDETHAEGVPHIIYQHTDDFVEMAGRDGVPAIYWVNDGVAEFKSQYAYYQLDPRYMEDWIAGKKF